MFLLMVNFIRCPGVQNIQNYLHLHWTYICCLCLLLFMVVRNTARCSFYVSHCEISLLELVYTTVKKKTSNRFLKIIFKRLIKNFLQSYLQIVHVVYGRDSFQNRPMDSLWNYWRNEFFLKFHKRLLQKFSQGISIHV